MIVATNHALERWRERVAIYGDETIVHMREKLNQAIEAQGEIPKGISTYKVGSVVFVLDKGERLTQIVTVIDETNKVCLKEEDKTERESRVPKEPKEPKEPKKVYEPTIQLPEFLDKSHAQLWLHKELEIATEKFGVAKANLRLIEKAIHEVRTNQLDKLAKPAIIEIQDTAIKESERSEL